MILKAHYIFSFLLVFLQLNVFSQSIDSLLHVLEDKPIEEQIKLLNKECWKFRSKKPLYALAAGTRALQLGEKIDDKSLLASTSNYLGVVERNLGHFGEAMHYYQDALDYSKSVGDSIQIAYSLNNIGGIHRMQRQFTLALEDIFSALEIFEGLNYEEGIAFCYINIGIIYRERKEFDKALKYLKKSMEIREKLGDKFGTTLALSHIAEVYFQQGLYEKTYSTYLKLLESYKELDDTKGIAYVYGGLSILHYEQGNYKEALSFRIRSLELNKKIMNTEGIIISLCYLSRIYGQLGMLDKAKESLDEAAEIMTQTDLALAKKYYLSALSDYYVFKGDYKKAYKAYLEFDAFRDSIAHSEDETRIAAIESMYNVERMNRENALLQKNLELKNFHQTLLAIIAFISIIFLIVILLKDRKTRRLNAELRENNVTKDRFFSIIAHDLRNPFNSILGYSDLLLNDYDSFTDKERIDAVKEMNSATKKLYGLVNNLLEWSRAQTNRMTIDVIKFNPKEELQNIVDILQPIARKKDIDIRVLGRDDKEIYCDENIFHTVFRNLINNAIKYTPKNGVIMITVDETHKYIEISVKDNGVGIPEKRLNTLFDLSVQNSTKGTDKEEGTGLGLILVKELLDKVGAKIRVESKVNVGSKFTVCFPKKTMT